MKHLILPCLFALLPFFSGAQMMRLAEADPAGLAGIEEQLSANSNRWVVKQARAQAGNASSPFLITVSDAELESRLQSLHSSIELYDHPLVRRYIDVFLNQKRTDFEAVLGLTQHYLPLFRRHLSRHGLPQELQYLPVALSALNPRAVSKNGGSGVWQLPYLQAVRFGLEVNEDLDERRDIEKSTAVAAALLREHYAQYGDWTMAIAAFCNGNAAVQRARGRVSGDPDFWGLYASLPAESRDFVPAFIAAVYCCRFYAEHGITPLAMELPTRTDDVSNEKPMDISTVGEVLNVPLALLQELNPVLRSFKVPVSESFTGFHLPEGQSVKFAEQKENIYKLSEVRLASRVPAAVTISAADVNAMSNASGSVSSGKTLTWYTIRSGDNLGSIAAKFHVRVSDIKSWNKLSSDRIRAGSKLKIYVPAKKTAAASSAASGSTSKPVPSPAATKPATTPASASATVYEVKSGDTLWSISKKYPGVTEADIMKANGISEKIHPGQKLKIPVIR